MPVALLFFISCICFCLLAFIAVFNPARVNVVANKWMGLFYISVACMMLTPAIISFGFGARFNFVIGFNELTRFAMMPALYLGIVQFTTPGSRFSNKDYLHMLPFAAFGILQIFALSGHNLLTQRQDEVVTTTLRVVIRCQFLIYLILAYKRLNNHQKHIKLITADVEPVSLNWLKHLLLIIGFMLLLFFITIIFEVSISNLLTPALYLAGSLAILYYSLAQKEIYPYHPEELQSIRQVFVTVDDGAKASKQRLTDSETEQLQARLKHLMTVDKLYLDAALSLPQLAASMTVTVNDLSYLLNDTLGTNFFQFVNAHRVEEAKQLMLSEKHKHLNLLGIAYSAGFNSKTTFNTAFKKETGLSPTQFIQNAKSGRELVSSVAQ